MGQWRLLSKKDLNFVSETGQAHGMEHRAWAAKLDAQQGIINAILILGKSEKLIN